VQVTDAQFCQSFLKSRAVDEGVFCSANAAPPANVAESIYPGFLECVEKRSLAETKNTNRNKFHGVGSLSSISFPFVLACTIPFPRGEGSFSKKAHLPFREPIDYLCLRDHHAVFINVGDRDAYCRKGLADEFAAMALLWPALTAHQRHRLLLLEGFSEPLIPSLEEW
jgi:hypothetical protein